MNILYSFRRCPYAIRARWALLKTNQLFALREVSIRNKPQALLTASPKGTVPVLITDKGKVIDESLNIMIWTINQCDTNDYFFRWDTEAQITTNSIIKTNDCLFKFHLDRYKYPQRYLECNCEYHKTAAREILLELNNRLSGTNTTKWLVSQRESIADWAVWPFVRQFRNVDKRSFDNDKEISRLKLWLDYFTDHKL